MNKQTLKRDEKKEFTFAKNKTLRKSLQIHNNSKQWRQRCPFDSTVPSRTSGSARHSRSHYGSTSSFDTARRHSRRSVLGAAANVFVDSRVSWAADGIRRRSRGTVEPARARKGCTVGPCRVVSRAPSVAARSARSPHLREGLLQTGRSLRNSDPHLGLNF